jgi:TrmH family RNA methyltransferase
METCHQKLILALDGVQDPGNLGTICRLADWFGIEDIICSTETADIFNPKAIQATMGAIARVRIHYTNLTEFLTEVASQDTRIYGTFLDGKNIYERELTPHGIIVMGNEGKGISPDIEALVTDKLFIPNYPSDRPTTESLNVAVATAITCAEFRRRAVSG